MRSMCAYVLCCWLWVRTCTSCDRAMWHLPCLPLRGGSFLAGGQSWYWESVKTSPAATFPANDLLSLWGVSQKQEAVDTGAFVTTVSGLASYTLCSYLSLCSLYYLQLPGLEHLESFLVTSSNSIQSVAAARPFLLLAGTQVPLFQVAPIASSGSTPSSCASQHRVECNSPLHGMTCGYLPDCMISMCRHCLRQPSINHLPPCQ
jgi:hypothetical protein